MVVQHRIRSQSAHWLWTFSSVGWSPPALAQTFPGADWQRKNRPRPASARTAEGCRRFCDRERSQEPARPQAQSLPLVRPRAVRRGIGPFKERGDLTGVIIHKGGYRRRMGRARARRHDPQRHQELPLDRRRTRVRPWHHSHRRRHHVEICKRPFKSTIQMPAGSSAPPDAAPDPIDLFDSPHNRTITWDHLLRQTSDWEGTLWGKPDWADRPATSRRMADRPRNKAGTVYKYNDVRVNVLALAALNVWRRRCRRCSRKDHGPDRREQHLALARLRELLGDDRWPADAVGERRRSLGRWHVDHA